ncbi:MAG: iron chelate uptake ABC transporter family permease subunit [Clostridiales bacterium]|nr:iron chelate uptake ABC transporter family permease subunit [Clostridiales bacterium]
MNTNRITKNKHRNTKIFFFLTVLYLLVIGIFVLWGLTAKNFDFFFPRRISKILTMLFVSYAIGYSSITFQTITNNQILTPSIMGLDSLYLFIQTVVVFFFGSGQLSLLTGIPNFTISILGMLLATSILYLLLFRGESKNIYFLVLTGMVLGSLFNGMATFMQVLLDPNEFSVLEGKMFASFNNINTDLLGICIFIVLGIVWITRKDIAYLNALTLGTDYAINLGVDYKHLVLKTLLISGVLVSISTALLGPITFLGIILASLSRQLFRTYRHNVLIVGATLIGGLFLTFGLLLTERVLNYQTNISVILNFLGGTYFIYLIIKEAKR